MDNTDVAHTYLAAEPSLACIFTRYVAVAKEEVGSDDTRGSGSWFIASASSTCLSVAARASTMAGVLEGRLG